MVSLKVAENGNCSARRLPTGLRSTSRNPVFHETERALRPRFLFPDKFQLDVQIAARSDRLPNPDLRGDDAPRERRKQQGSLIMTGVQNDFSIGTGSAVPDSLHEADCTYIPTNRSLYGC
jgi:hypothetical protein